MEITQANDIYSFINSKDIGEYCRKINHKFNPLEAAYLIWRSERRTLKERHTSWTELINTTPDMPIPDTQYKSLHEFLHIYMKMENDYIEEFFAADSAVYTCTVYSDSGRYEIYPEIYVFKSIDDCFEFIQKLKSKITVIDFYIRKSSLNRQAETVDLHYSSSFEPLRIINTLSKTDLFHTFCKLCPIVPTPFKQGDIVKIYNAEYRKNYMTQGKPTAYVLDAIGYWDIADNEEGLNKSANYNAILYSYCGLDVNAIEYIQIPDARSSTNEIEAWGFMENYLDLEYYHGELKGKERILTGISNYLKGNINLSFLMNTYGVMSAETNFKNMIFPTGFYSCNKELLKMGGWTKEDIDKFEQIDLDLFNKSEQLMNVENIGIDKYACKKIDEEGKK